MLKAVSTSPRPAWMLRHDASLCRELARGAVSPRSARELESIAHDLESEATQLDTDERIDLDEKIAVEADY